MPDDLRHGPFSLERSRELGVTRRVLARQAVRVHPRVWCHRHHELTGADLVLAASLAMPESAHLTGITRLQQLGLDYGPVTPIRFVIEGDHHLAIDGVFLHRTKKLPPLDEVGVTPAAAYLAFCAAARLIDALKVGDWLLHREHVTRRELLGLALAELWRPGAHEAVWCAERLRDDARSLPESEVAALLTYAGLPEPELNAPVDDDHRIIGDLVYRRWRTVVEYEGAQHQEDRVQYVRDLGRYGWMRENDVGYVQVTHEKLRQPRGVVGEVFRQLVRGGYDGPPPVFGDRWASLFMRVSTILGPRHHWQR